MLINKSIRTKTFTGILLKLFTKIEYVQKIKNNINQFSLKQKIISILII